jgi:hypothetical protein
METQTQFKDLPLHLVSKRSGGILRRDFYKLIDKRKITAIYFKEKHAGQTTKYPFRLTYVCWEGEHPGKAVAMRNGSVDALLLKKYRIQQWLRKYLSEQGKA